MNGLHCAEAFEGYSTDLAIPLTLKRSPSPEGFADGTSTGTDNVRKDFGRDFGESIFLEDFADADPT